MSARGAIPVLLAAAVVAVALGVRPSRPPEVSSWDAVTRLAGVDLAALSPAARARAEEGVIRDVLRRVPPQEAKAAPGDEDVARSFFEAPFTPAAVLDPRREDGALLIVERDVPIMWPSEIRAAVSLVPREGTARRWEMQVGYRAGFEGASCERSPSVEGPLVCIRTSVGGFYLVGTPIPQIRQYYAIRGERLLLVRLERDGALLRDQCFFPNLRIGPEPGTRTAEAWLDDLSSSDAARRLSALVWLGGIHLHPGEHEAPRVLANEGAAPGRLAAEVRERARPLLQEWSGSPDAWLREAAQAALAPEYPDSSMWDFERAHEGLARPR